MNNFWKNKKVFLPGHTGFKGSWLSLWLQALGAKVTGYALLPSTNPNMFDRASIEDGMISIIGDIRDINHLSNAIRGSNPEIVIHMAAQSLVRYSYQNPAETYATNVMGTVNILEAVRSLKKVRSFINVTSDKCYENKEWLWGYREVDSLGGHDPYSSSKACSELITNAYRESFFSINNFEEHKNAIASARAGNVLGGGDWSNDRLVPDFIRSITNKKLIDIRNPNAMRPWQHVLEPLKGYLLLAENLYNHGPKYAEAWNFGPNNFDVKSVNEILELLIFHWEEAVGVNLKKDPSNLHEAFLLKLDSSKARAKLNWQSKWDINESIKRTCEWYKAHLKNQDMRAYSLKEILDYERL